MKGAVPGPGATGLDLGVEVTTTGSETGLPNEANDWRCFTYQVESLSAVTANFEGSGGSGDVANSGTNTRSVSTLAAPGVTGTYDITVKDYADDGSTACPTRSS
ncbi:MAG: hypothetical protein IPH65_02860 [Dehalococcoidia bacterium]|uniref:hypothetical protein n=1 Tax=Candidatus Amarobacter glycogenicus TaxID=3140699 RepID=UPI003135D711|nr:hypothetical protein [Dehalococcoidia bacterium]